MLKMRARWALRDTFSDVLKGLHLREEMEDLERSRQPEQAQEPAEDALADVPAPPTEAAADPAQAEETVAEHVKTEQQQVIEEATFPGDKPASQQKAADPADTAIPWGLDRKLSDNDRDWLLCLKEAFEQCHDADEVTAEAETLMLPAKDTMSAYCWQKAADLMDEHIERVNRG
jgi:hypothetical protein